MSEQKSNQNQAGGNPNAEASGSDTVSAARNPVSPVGQSPRPNEGFSSSGRAGGSDTASAAAMASGTAGSHAPQSATLSSHTSRPLGGSPGVGAGSSDARNAAQDAAGSARQAAQGVADTLRQTAQTATDAARRTTDELQRQARDAYDSATDTARRTADDLKQQARDSYDQASSWAAEQYEAASRNLDHAGRRTADEMSRARHGIERFIQDNPVLVGVMGLAAGLVIGSLLPRTRPEDRAFGRWADEVREQGVRYARDMTQRGREYVEESLGGDDAHFASPQRDRGGEERPGQRATATGRYQNH
jgi:ElaB/YqjD/DUF883 family membrane-anchored ribosome-binding protein